MGSRIGYAAGMRKLGLILGGIAVLFVLIVVQTIIGHIITDGHHPGLIVVHVPLALLVFAILMGLLVVYRHRANIARLRAGTESRLGQKKREPATPAANADST